MLFVNPVGINGGYNMQISKDQFSALPPDEQLRIMKELIKDFSVEELQILKTMIDNERKSRS